MKTEYEVYQNLVWDNEFRRKFSKNRKIALNERFPNYKPHLFLSETAKISGLEEEAYRRLATLYRNSKIVFPFSHNLLLCFFGNTFFEKTLLYFFNKTVKKSTENYNINEPLNIHDVGLLIFEAFTIYGSKHSWIKSLLEYELKIWNARCVNSGWTPILPRSPNDCFIHGLSIFETNIDLEAILDEIVRLENSSVSYEIFKWRIKPRKKKCFFVIFPKDSEVVKGRLSSELFSDLKIIFESTDLLFEKENLSIFYDMGLFKE